MNNKIQSGGGVAIYENPYTLRFDVVFDEPYDNEYCYSISVSLDIGDVNIARQRNATVRWGLKTKNGFSVFVLSDSNNGWESTDTMDIQWQSSAV